MQPDVVGEKYWGEILEKVQNLHTPSGRTSKHPLFSWLLLKRKKVTIVWCIFCHYNKLNVHKREIRTDFLCSVLFVWLLLKTKKTLVRFIFCQWIKMNVHNREIHGDFMQDILTINFVIHAFQLILT